MVVDAAMVSGPRPAEPSEPKTKVPSLTVKPPVFKLSPLKVSEPRPFLRRAPEVAAALPLITRFVVAVTSMEFTDPSRPVPKPASAAVCRVKLRSVEPTAPAASKTKLPPLKTRLEAALEELPRPLPELLPPLVMAESFQAPPEILTEPRKSNVPFPTLNVPEPCFSIPPRPVMDTPEES